MKNIPKKYHPAVRKLIKKVVDKREQELTDKIKQFQLIYGNFNSSTGVLMDYKTNEYGDNPVDLLINLIKKEL